MLGCADIVSICYYNLVPVLKNGPGTPILPMTMPPARPPDGWEACKTACPLHWTLRWLWPAPPGQQRTLRWTWLRKDLSPPRSPGNPRKALAFPSRYISVSYGLGIEEHDHEGRVITAEFPEYYIVTCYTPNSKDGLARLDYRMTWEDAFLAYLKKLEEKKPVIFCGDLNVAVEEIDLKNPKTNRKNSWFLRMKNVKK